MAFSCPLHQWYSLEQMCPICYGCVSAPASADIEIKTNNSKQITMTNDYIPYGEDWVREMKKLPKDFLIDMLKKSLMGQDAAREDEAIAFAEWVTETYRRDISGGIYNYWRDEEDRIHTTKELYQLYLKHKNEKL